MEKNKRQTEIITENFVSDIRTIIEQGRKQAYAASGQIAIMTYWNIGRRIVEEEQHGASRAAYGQKLIPALAVRLSAEYGTGYGKRNLAYYRKFYLEFKDIEILHTRVQNLTWSHIRRLLSVSNTQAREWYLKTAAEDMWSVDDLDRNISSQYYERRLAAQRENSTLPVPYTNQTDPLEYIKNPMMAEFMGFHRDTNYSESELEQALIDNLEKFIMELGCGFALVERQQHIVTDTADYYIDLVFYNYKMKRFVIFELKTHKLPHQDIGQLDIYIRMYDDLIKGDDYNPTIGVLLCIDTDKTIAKYSVLHDSDQFFAAKYMTYLPSEEELRREIEQQKRFFMEQMNKRRREMESSSIKRVRLGNYIEPCNERNTKEMYSMDNVRGISIEKRIIDTKANMDGVSVTNYKLYRTNYFCYVPVTSRNVNKITLALNTYDATYIVSSAYEVFRVKDDVELLPLYLFLFFLRPEFDQYARFNSWGSARETFSFEDMKRCKVSLPSIEVQQAIVNIHKCAKEAKQIAEEADRLSQEVCQALLQYVVNS